MRLRWGWGWGGGCHTKEESQNLQACTEVGLISEVLGRLEKAGDVAGGYILGGGVGGGCHTKEE